MKLGSGKNIVLLVLSPPTRGRGLKLIFQGTIPLHSVAPHAGAWIETG